MTMTKHSSKIAEWKKLADIDYYGMFVKAYIPFNAWLNDNFSEPKDREKINRIKSKPNRFRDKITNLLDSPSQEGANFRNSIGALHHCLEICPLQNQGETITFSDVYIGKNPQNVFEDKYRGIGIRVQYGNGGDKTETLSLIKNRKGNALFSCKQKDYDFEEISKNADLGMQKTDYRTRLLECYKQANPNLKVNLLANPKENEDNKYLMGSITFIKDKEKIAQGLIEIIYNLRNTLFHGELDPNEYTNNIYGAAYKILRELIEAL